MQLNDPPMAAMQAVATFTVATCFYFSNILLSNNELKQ